MSRLPLVLFLEQISLPISFLEELLHARVMVSASPFDALHKVGTYADQLSMIVVDSFFLHLDDFVKMLRFLNPDLKIVVMNSEGVKQDLQLVLEDVIVMPDELEDLRGVLGGCP